MVPGADKGILNRCYDFESSVFQLSNELVPMDSLTLVGWADFPTFSFQTASHQFNMQNLPLFTSLTSTIIHVSLLPVLSGYGTSPVRVRLLTCLCSDSVLCI